MQERLIPDEVAATIPALGATEECEAPLAAVHLFTPSGGWDWYLTEYDPETGEAFGLVRGIETEWGYFSVSEMEGLNRSRGASLAEGGGWASVFVGEGDLEEVNCETAECVFSAG